MPIADDHNSGHPEHGQSEVIDHARLVKRVENIYGRVLAALAATVSLRDEAASGHCERVAHNSTALARALAHKHERAQEGGESKATEQAIDLNFNSVYWASMLHDIGKIVVPEEILLAARPLTEPEMEIVKTHVDVGADLIAGLSYDFDAIAEGIRSHHEWWDGSGYPQGLKGEEIPQVGRCIAIADVFEAMTTPRPYHQRIGEREGLDHIRSLAGTHLWPEGVEAFCDLWREGGIFSSRSRFIPPVEGVPPLS